MHLLHPAVQYVVLCISVQCGFIVHHRRVMPQLEEAFIMHILPEQQLLTDATRASQLLEMIPDDGT